MIEEIFINENQSIKWINFNSEKIQPRNIDSLLDGTHDFWKGLETECVAECCGIQAFSFFKIDIKNALENLDKEEIHSNLIIAKNELLKIKEEVVVSGLLNQLIHKKIFLELLNHIIACLNHTNTN